jgi:hypothetical protein
MYIPFASFFLSFFSVNFANGPNIACTSAPATTWYLLEYYPVNLVAGADHVHAM